MSQFFIVFFWTLIFLSFFSCIGGAFVTPFKKYIKYPLLTAPFTGILVTMLGVSVCYCLLNLSISKATLLIFLLGTLATCIAIYQQQLRFPKMHYALSLFLLLWVAGITYCVNYTEIMLGTPSLLFSDGTDHLGYVQLADWLMAHSVYQTPILSVQNPYESWPYQMFHFEPRFGSFYLLAVFSFLKQLPAMFAYNISVGVILISGVLAVSGVFARSTQGLILAIVGLTCAQWYPLGQRGYFGKIIAFPATFFIAGLFFSIRKHGELIPVLTLIFLTCAAAISYPGNAIAAIFFVLTSGYFIFSLFFRYVFQKPLPRNFLEIFFVMMLLLVIAVGMSGQLSHPFSGLGGENSDWQRLWKQLLELPLSEKHQFLSLPVSLYLLSLMLLSTTVMIIIACKRRAAIPAALLIFPFLFIGCLEIFDSPGQRWIAYEFIGVFYPALLLAAIRLFEKPSHPLLICLILIVGIHIPKFTEARHHYAGKGVLPDRQYSKINFEQMAEKIGNQSVLIKINDTPHALPLLVEFGRRNIKMEWTPASWRAVVGYRPWSAPAVTAAVFHLTALNTHETGCTNIFQTQEYQLLKCHQQRTN